MAAAMKYTASELSAMSVASEIEKHVTSLESCLDKTIAMRDAACGVDKTALRKVTKKLDKALNAAVSAIEALEEL